MAYKDLTKKKEYSREYNRKRWIKEGDRLRKSHKKWRRENQKHINKYQKEWRHRKGISKYYREEGMTTGWNGKKTYTTDGKEYNKNFLETKKKIYKRDKWICQECGIKCVGKNSKYTKRIIQCHHIDYNTTNDISKNLITLCLICHLKTNFNRKDWTCYFNRKSSQDKHKIKL